VIPALVGIEISADKLLLDPRPLVESRGGAILVSLLRGERVILAGPTLLGKPRWACCKRTAVN